MKFLFFITILSVCIIECSSYPASFSDKSCGKLVMARYWALCPAGSSTSDSRSVYLATLMCGVGFSDEEIQNVLCPQVFNLGNRFLT
ncbi:unnamed protein product [Caenorhabditis brenneri]